jgi:hypothetical protein
MDIHGIIFDDEYHGEPVNLGGLDTAPCELVVGPGVEATCLPEEIEYDKDYIMPTTHRAPGPAAFLTRMNNK